MKFGQVYIAACLAMACGLAAAGELELMSYNVENLFDAEHDRGKDDWTFMPLGTPGKEEACNKVKIEHYKKECLETDWTDKKVDLKLSQIKRVFDSRKSLPDIVGLSEVENEEVVGRLAKELGYKRLQMTNSPDQRGVDVAVLYNPSKSLKYVSSRTRRVTEENHNKPTRDILEVQFEFEGNPLAVYVNHWPSQGGDEDDTARVQVATSLKEFMAEARKKKEGIYQVALGDFNCTDKDKPDSIKDVMLTTKGGLKLRDVHQMRNTRQQDGTYFYWTEKSWHRFDRFFVNEEFTAKSAVGIVPDSYEIYKPELIQRESVDKESGKSYTIPHGYWHNAETAAKAGFSDHYPIYLKLESR